MQTNIVPYAVHLCNVAMEILVAASQSKEFNDALVGLNKIDFELRGNQYVFIHTPNIHKVYPLRIKIESIESKN